MALNRWSRIGARGCQFLPVVALVVAAGVMSRSTKQSPADGAVLIGKGASDLTRAEDTKLMAGRMAVLSEVVGAAGMADVAQGAAMLAASDDLQRAREEAESDSREDEGQFVMLQRVLGQLNTQLLSLRDKLAEAKNDTIALKELVAVYQKKVREEFEASQPAPPPPDTFEPAASGVRLLAPPIIETPVETTPAPPQQEQPPAPSEQGLFSMILDWLLSVWNAIVAFFRSFFP